MGIRFLAQRLDCLPCLCLQARSENGFVRVPIIFGYRRGFGTVRPARMEFLVGRPKRLRIGFTFEAFLTLHLSRSLWSRSNPSSNSPMVICSCCGPTHGRPPCCSAARQLFGSSRHGTGRSRARRHDSATLVREGRLQSQRTPQVSGIAVMQFKLKKMAPIYSSLLLALVDGYSQAHPRMNAALPVSNLLG
jgi:hypothetical protein